MKGKHSLRATTNAPAAIVRALLSVLILCPAVLAQASGGKGRIDGSPSSWDITKVSQAMVLIGQVDMAKYDELKDMLESGKLKYLAHGDKAEGFANKSQGVIAVKAKGRTVLQIAGVLLHELLHLHSTEQEYNISEGNEGVCDVDTPDLVAGLGAHGALHEETYWDCCLMSCLLVSDGEIVDCAEVVETLLSAQGYYKKASDVAGEEYPGLRDAYTLEAQRVQRLAASIKPETCCCIVF